MTAINFPHFWQILAISKGTWLILALSWGIRGNMEAIPL
jgi:hypothetical protein